MRLWWGTLRLGILPLVITSAHGACLTTLGTDDCFRGEDPVVQAIAHRYLDAPAASTPAKKTQHRKKSNRAAARNRAEPEQKPIHNKKAPNYRGLALFSQDCLDYPYFRAVWTLPKVVFKVEPTPCTAATITIEMPPAMRAYSMAVAPDSSFAKRLKSFFTAYPYLPAPGPDAEMLRGIAARLSASRAPGLEVI
jgi:hypothetical protein